MSGPLSLFRKLAQESKRYHRELNPEQLELMRRYQEASDINDLLRSQYFAPSTSPWHARRAQEAETMDAILRAAPRTPEPLVVHRAAPEGVYPGTEPAFLSTSFDEAATRPFLEALGDQTTSGASLYKIEVPGDTPFFAPVDLVPEYADQKELIFPRGASLNEVGGLLRYRRGRYAAGGCV